MIGSYDLSWLANGSIWNPEATWGLVFQLNQTWFIGYTANSFSLVLESVESGSMSMMVPAKTNLYTLKCALYTIFDTIFELHWIRFAQI